MQIVIPSNYCNGYVPGETPSGQHPKYDAVQFSALMTSHPSKLGPTAIFIPSGQQPWVDFEQSTSSRPSSPEPETCKQYHYMLPLSM